MKPASRFLLLAALAAMPCVNALSAPPADAADTDAAAKPAAPVVAKQPAKPTKSLLSKSKGADKAASARADALKGASKEKLNEEHTVAAVTFHMGGEDYSVMFELLEKDAPKTVQNFIENVGKGTYQGVAVHRAIDDYLVQTGDPKSKDNSTRETWGTSQEYTVPGEFKLPHVVGSVAMARRSDKVNPNRVSNGTQFYFVLGNMAALSGSYTVFGQVVSGMEVLKKISHAVADTNDCPLERIEIKDVKVFEQKGPLLALNATGKPGKRATKPEALKGSIEKFIERVW